MGAPGCAVCGASLAGRRADTRFCSDKCRKAGRKLKRAAEAAEPVPTAVADALAQDLAKLGMAASYEGQVALGIARQLDNGTVVGAAYASLSKELDRRVEALRVKAERPGDPAKVIKGRLEEKRARLA